MTDTIATHTAEQGRGASSAGWRSVMCGWVPQPQHSFFPELGSVYSVAWCRSGAAPRAYLILKPSAQTWGEQSDPKIHHAPGQKPAWAQGDLSSAQETSVGVTRL